jgi:hypothetical protein
MTEMQVVTEDSEWQLVSLDQLKVTTGKREVQQTASGFLSLNSAKTRALLTAGYQRHVLKPCLRGYRNEQLLFC